MIKIRILLISVILCFPTHSADSHNQNESKSGVFNFFCAAGTKISNEITNCLDKHLPQEPYKRQMIKLASGCALFAGDIFFNGYPSATANITDFSAINIASAYLVYDGLQGIFSLAKDKYIEKTAIRSKKHKLSTQRYETVERERQKNLKAKIGYLILSTSDCLLGAAMFLCPAFPSYHVEEPEIDAFIFNLDLLFRSIGATALGKGLYDLHALLFAKGQKQISAPSNARYLYTNIFFFSGVIQYKMFSFTTRAEFLSCFHSHPDTMRYISDKNIEGINKLTEICIIKALDIHDQRLYLASTVPLGACIFSCGHCILDIAKKTLIILDKYSTKEPEVIISKIKYAQVQLQRVLETSETNISCSDFIEQDLEERTLEIRKRAQQEISRKERKQKARLTRDKKNSSKAKEPLLTNKDVSLEENILAKHLETFSDKERVKLDKFLNKIEEKKNIKQKKFDKIVNILRLETSGKNNSGCQKYYLPDGTLVFMMHPVHGTNTVEAGRLRSLKAVWESAFSPYETLEQ